MIWFHPAMFSWVAGSRRGMALPSVPSLLLPRHHPAPPKNPPAGTRSSRPREIFRSFAICSSSAARSQSKNLCPTPGQQHQSPWRVWASSARGSGPESWAPALSPCHARPLQPCLSQGRLQNARTGTHLDQIPHQHHTHTHTQIQTRDISLLSDTVSYPVPQGCSCCACEILAATTQPRDTVCHAAMCHIAAEGHCTHAGGDQGQPCQPGPHCGHPRSAPGIPSGSGLSAPSQGTRLERGSSPGMQGAAAAPDPLPGASTLPGQHPGAKATASTPRPAALGAGPGPAHPLGAKTPGPGPESQDWDQVWGQHILLETEP